MMFVKGLPNCFASHVLVLIIISYVIRHVRSKVHLPNALGYETANKGKKVAEYGDEPYEWANMRKVLRRKGMKKLGSLCVTGTFLLYGKADYQARNEREIRLLSGIDVCTPPGMALSIQAASPFRNIHDPSIVLFKEKIIRGLALPISKRMDDIDTKFSATVQSFIINGQDPYTAYSSEGNSYCLKPKSGSSKESICMMLDIKNTIIEKDNHWISIHKGCDGEALQHLINVDNCIAFGSGKLEKINYSGNSKISSNSTHNKLGVNNNSPIKDCKNTELLDLLSFRFSNDFSSDFQMRFPVDKKLTWRTELLDSAFDIMIATCPDDVVRAEFLQGIREFYIFVAEKIWAAGKAWPKNKTLELSEIIEMTDHCLYIIKELNAEESYQSEPLNVLQGMKTPTYNSQHIFPEFIVTQKIMDDKFLVMEIVWRVYNHVAAICHHIYDFESNYWPDFSVIFYDMYLEPMSKMWANPGTYQLFHQVIFGGLNLAQQLEGLSICVSSVFNTIPNLEILARPGAVLPS